jgi:hypothetical protein
MYIELQRAGDVAQAIGVRPATVLMWARQGRIPRVRVSPRCVRFSLRDVLRALKEGAVDDEPAAS